MCKIQVNHQPLLSLMGSNNTEVTFQVKSPLCPAEAQSHDQLATLEAPLTQWKLACRFYLRITTQA